MELRRIKKNQEESRKINENCEIRRTGQKAYVINKSLLNHIL